MDYKQIIEKAFAGIDFQVKSYGHIYGIEVTFNPIDRQKIFAAMDKHNIPCIGATAASVTIPKR